jgi:O-antigen ligase
LLTPLLGLASGLAIAPLVTLVAVALLVASGWRDVWRDALDRLQWALILAFLLWAGLSLIWTPAPSAVAARSWAMTAGVVAAGAAVIAASRRVGPDGNATVVFSLSAGMAVAAVALLAAAAITRNAERSSTFGYDYINSPLIRTAFEAVTRFDRGSTVLAVLLGPALAGLIRLNRRGAAVALGGISLLALLIDFDLSAKVAALLGLAVALATYLWRRPFLAGLAGILPVVLVVAPSIAARLPSPDPGTLWAHLPLSARHRMAIWRFVADSIGQHPLRGWGFEASREIGLGRKVVLAQPDGQPIVADLLPLHPHDAPLQIWLELGPFGMALAGLFVAALIWRLRSSAAPPLATAGAAAALVAALAVASLSYGFWQSWWLCTLWLAAALAIIELRAPAPVAAGSG